MTSHAKLLARVLSGSSDKNIKFELLCNLLKRLGFIERVSGDHHIYWMDDIPEILNLQPRRHLAKPYQVKQIRTVILKYKLGDKLEKQK